MRGLAKLFLKNSVTAHLTLAVIVSLGFVLQPLVILAGAGVSLITLTYGWQKSLSMVFLATALTYLLGLFYSIGSLDVWLLLFGYLLPVVFFSLLLKGSLNQALTVSFVALFSLLVIVVVRLYWGDPEEFWYQQLKELFRDANIADAMDDKSIKEIARMFVPAIAMMTFVVITSSLFIGRFWQSREFNPGGFGEEFRQYSLGRIISVLSVGIVTLAFLEFSLAVDFASVVIILLGLQAIAILHTVFYSREWKKQGLIGFYLLIICSLILSQYISSFIFVLLAITGCIDNWIDIRKRILATVP